ncbi:CheR family methyltransferase [Pseudomonas sp. RIT-PI-AD]|uniref:CheR family methyltransferase n=1 Tax=Pseudomonas sp. RIT-PI-AD TaxID=3035294 RepID=UPI0021D93152|nr:CheR family methyltransferase [Pseudomonas sp. RIT-PI-AD]
MSSGLQMPPLGDAEFQRLQRLMAEVSGIRMADHKRSLVAGRLMKRLRHFGLSSYGEYLNLLSDANHVAERRLVVDLLTTNETYFFREPKHFDFLSTWLASRRAPVRIWSAACSSGEEPYTLAMVAAEHAVGNDWSIFASDLSQRMLEKAATGIYDLSQAQHFPAGWLHKHCLRGVGEHEGSFRVSSKLREHVSFREINLTHNLPEQVGPFDAIFLRNVLIYFESAEKCAIVGRLIQRLREDGLLFIGHAESLHGFDLPLRSVQPSVYRRL